jgi:hypothetical protein
MAKTNIQGWKNCWPTFTKFNTLSENRNDQWFYTLPCECTCSPEKISTFFRHFSTDSFLLQMGHNLENHWKMQSPFVGSEKLFPCFLCPTSQHTTPSDQLCFFTQVAYEQLAPCSFWFCFPLIIILYLFPVVKPSQIFWGSRPRRKPSTPIQWSVSPISGIYIVDISLMTST